MKDYKEAIESIMKDTTSKVMDHAIRAYRQGYENGLGKAQTDSYVKGYEDGKAATLFTDTEVAEKTAYERGLNEAWECAKNIYSKVYDQVGADDLYNIFGDRRMSYILKAYSASEAITKIKEYEEKQKADDEIKVGDEVIVQVDRIGFVTGFDVLFDRVYVTTKDGWSDAFGRSFVKKTGRHFDAIPEVLKQMNREEDK